MWDNLIIKLKLSYLQLELNLFLSHLFCTGLILELRPMSQLKGGHIVMSFAQILMQTLF